MMLRRATADDAAAVAAIYAPYVRDTAISFEIDPPDGAEMRRRIAAVGETYPWLIAHPASGDPVGYAYASRHRDRAAYRWSVDVTVYVHRDAHRRGTGRALYQALLPVVAAQGYRNAYAGITLPNAASVGVHEAMGFTPVGVYRRVGWKLGAWHDVGWWALELGSGAGDPDEPRPIGDVIDGAAWRAALDAAQSARHAGQKRASPG
ncbi:MAG: arsinothricin resistance N-acetyltransferase ArsN1 family B [Candidatus Binatia bacterium]